MVPHVTPTTPAEREGEGWRVCADCQKLVINLNGTGSWIGRPCVCGEECQADNVDCSRLLCGSCRHWMGGLQ